MLLTSKLAEAGEDILYHRHHRHSCEVSLQATKM
jgi:hypothetical protein